MLVIMFTMNFSYMGMFNWFPELYHRMALTGGSPCSISELNTTILSYIENITCNDTVPDSVYFESFLTATAKLPGIILCVILMDRIGRKALLAPSAMLAAISVFCIVFLDTKTQSVISTCVFAGLAAIMWNVLLVLSSEVVITHLRAIATGVFFGAAHIGVITAMFTFGDLLDVYCVVSLSLVGGFLFIASILTLCLPNTTKIYLP